MLRFYIIPKIILMLLHSGGIIMSQQKYIRDILERSNMGAKVASTPITTSTFLSLNYGSVTVERG